MGNVTRSFWAIITQNRLIGLVLGMVVLVPLVAAPANTLLHGGSALAFEALALGLLVHLVWRANWRVRPGQMTEFLRTSANLPLLLLGALAVVSCLCSPQRGYSVQETLRIWAGILVYFVAAYQFRRSEQLARIVDTLLFVAASASIVGFVQFGMHTNEFAVGVFGDHQLFGSFLMALLPFCVMAAITEKAPNRQMAAQVTSVLTGTCLLMAHSRSAWIGATAGLAVLAIGSLLRIARSSRQDSAQSFMANKHLVVLPLMLLLVAVAFFLLISPASAPIYGRFQSLTNISQDSTWQNRVHTWERATAMVRQHPLTGVGIGLYPVYQESFTGVGMPLSRIGGPSSLGEQAHNMYLQTAAELGLPGLALLLGSLLAFVTSAVRRLRTLETGLRASLLLASLAATVAIAIDAFASPSWQMPHISMFLWLMLGLGTACLRQRSRSVLEVAPPTRRVNWIARPAAVLASLGVLALLPSIVFAGTDVYAIPLRGTLTPADARIRGGAAIAYTLNVLFSDQVTRDVTLCNTNEARTVFSYTGGAGTAAGPNNRSYQSRFHENDSLIVKAVYTQTGAQAGQVTATTELTVHP